MEICDLSCYSRWHAQTFGSVPGSLRRRWEAGGGLGMAECQHVPAVTSPRRVPLGKDKEP